MELCDSVLPEVSFVLSNCRAAEASIVFVNGTVLAFGVYFAGLFFNPFDVHFDRCDQFFCCIYYYVELNSFNFFKRSYVSVHNRFECWYVFACEE